MDPTLEQILKVRFADERYFCLDAEDQLLFEITEDGWVQLKDLSAKENVFWMVFKGLRADIKEWKRIKLAMAKDIQSISKEYSAPELKIITDLGLAPEQLLPGSRSKP